MITEGWSIQMATKKTNAKGQRMDSGSLSKHSFENEYYKQACDDHRFYADMRFKQLSLFGVISGLLLNAFNASAAWPKMEILTSFGVIVTSVIWVMEVRSSMYAQKAKARIRLCETCLANTQIPENSPEDREGDFKPKWPLVNATNAVLFLYMATFVFWTTLLLVHLESSIQLVTGILFGAAFVLLVVFSIREYLPLLKHSIKSMSRHTRRSRSKRNMKAGGIDALNE